MSGRLWGSRVHPLNPVYHTVLSNFLLTIKSRQNQLMMKSAAISKTEILYSPPKKQTQQVNGHPFSKTLSSFLPQRPYNSITQLLLPKNGFRCNNFHWWTACCFLQNSLMSSALLPLLPPPGRPLLRGQSAHPSYTVSS